MGLPGSLGRPGTAARLVCPTLTSAVHSEMSDNLTVKSSCVLQVPRPGGEKDSGPVDGLHLRPRAARLPASAGPGNTMTNQMILCGL